LKRDSLPRVTVGSILRRSEDGKRFVVRSIHKAEPTEPHSGFHVTIAHEPWPHPLVPSKQLPIRTKPRKRKRRWFGGPAT
jgi:hypothetical protein